jgi:hypothetical protein
MIKYWTEHYWIVNDNRSPIKIKHSDICYPLPYYQQKIDNCDTLYPGIVVKYEENMYHLHDGLHRIAKLQEQKIFESLFYVVTPEERRNGILTLVDPQEDTKIQYFDEKYPNNVDPISITKKENKWIEEYGYKIIIVDVLPKFPIKVIQNLDEIKKGDGCWIDW